MALVMRVLALEGYQVHSKTAPLGLFLASYDPDGNDGLGDAHFTADPALAMRFESPRALLECWRAQSTVRPLRQDGRPNRPLTAYTIETVEVEG